MILSTEIEKTSGSKSIDIQDTVVLMGSCFSEHIGSKLIRYKFDCAINPFGTLYNTVSITKLILSSLGELTPEQSRVIQRDSFYFHLDAHSNIFAKTEQELLGLIEKQQQSLKERLKKSKYLIITLGSSIVHQYKKDNLVVANCHKLPSQLFVKNTLKSQDQIEEWESVIDTLKSLNKDLQLIMTVSPVRHIKEGLSRNNYSKSILRIVCEELSDSHDHIHYFPSYEVMNDELRDYRFYADDLIHPSQMAKDHIWSLFSNAWFNDKTMSFLREWEKIIRAMEHKPFHPASSGHQQFLKKTISKLEELSSFTDTSKEKAFFQAQLTS